MSTFLGHISLYCWLFPGLTSLDVLDGLADLVTSRSSSSVEMFFDQVAKIDKYLGTETIEALATALSYPSQDIISRLNLLSFTKKVVELGGADFTKAIKVNLTDFVMSLASHHQRELCSGESFIWNGRDTHDIILEQTLCIIV